MRPLRVLISVATFIALAACGSSGPTAPTSDSPAQSVEVGVAGGADAVLAPGGTLQLWARTHDKDGGTTDVTNVVIWQSSDPGVAIVGRDGLIRASKVGPVTVSATFRKLTGTLALNIIGCIATVPPKVVYNALGGYVQLAVTLSQSDCRWSASSSDTTWLQVFSVPPGSGSGTLNYQVAVNNTPETRTGTISIDVPGGRGATFTVVQEKPSCSLVLTPASRTVPASGGSFTLDLTASPATCEWFVNAYEGGNLKITGPRSGRGNATIGYTLVPNTLPYSPFYTIEVYPALRDSPPARHSIQQLR